MNFHLYASVQNPKYDRLSPTSSQMSSAPRSSTSMKSFKSQYSARRAYNSIRLRCHRVKAKFARPWHARHQDEQGDTTCEEFEFPYPSPLTFDFGTMRYEAANPSNNDDDDWYTTLATTLRRGYLDYDTFA